MVYGTDHLYNNPLLLQEMPNNVTPDQLGLAYCSFSFTEGSGPISFCYLKAFQMFVSVGAAGGCCYELYKQIKAYGWKFEWRFFAIVLMFASLCVNIAFCLWNTVYTLYSIESYLYSMYFLVIVGYVFRLYMRKNSWNSNPRNNHLFIVCLVLVGCLYTAILIDSIVKQRDSAMVNKTSCEQIWYLAINVCCLALCLLALLILYCSQREEREKLLLMSYEDSQIYSPFMSLWCWIGFNTLAQIVDLIETGLLISTTEQIQCRIIRDSQVGDNVLKFFFAIFTLITGYIATLLYFKHVRKGTGYIDNIDLQYSVDRSEDLRGSYGVEMFHSFMDGIA